MTSKKYENHEKEMLKSILSRSLTSDSPSQETIAKANDFSGKNSDDPMIKLKFRLLEEYENKSFDDIEGGEVIENSSGETLKITKKEKIDFSLNNNNLKSDLLSDLKLIPKIGPATERKLKEDGYKNLNDLTNHANFCDLAEIAIEKIESSSLKDTFNLILNSCYNKNTLLKCAGEVGYESFKFMDIETLGLSNVPIILIGVAEIDDTGKYITSTQYLLRKKAEEAAIIEGYLSHFDPSQDSTLITFNGVNFDVPFIKNRSNFYQIEDNTDYLHYDLLYYARRLWKDKLPNYKLNTIEKKLFGIERIDDVPGQHIPSYYETYLKENNIGPLIPIIEHNRIDITSLAKFLMRMYHEI